MSAVKVILRADVNQVGKRGDICEVADGYARNYLLPRGLALVANDGAVNQAKSMRRARDLKDAKDRSAAEEIARALVSKTVTLTYNDVNGAWACASNLDKSVAPKACQ